MSGEYISFKELKKNKRWKSKKLFPKNKILRIDRLEAPNILPKLKSTRNLHSIRLFGKFTRLPPALFELSELQTLDLSQNKLKHLPKEIIYLQNLKSLDLSDNKLIELPEELFLLPNLERLFLEENVLQEISPSISKLKKLHTLYLAENLLSKLPASFTEMHHLKEVSLVDNLLTQISGNFSAWTQLKHFYLAGNPLLTPPTSIPKISLTIKEVNSLSSYLLSNTNLKEINIFDSCKYASIEEILSQLVPEIQKNESVHISEW